MIIAVHYVFVVEQNQRRLESRPAHREWLTSLKADGRLVQGGPFADGLGALLVFNVADEEALDELLQADPYPKDAFVVSSRRAWVPLFEV